MTAALLGLVLSFVLAVGAGLFLGSVTLGAHRARAAADLGSLAAAEALQIGQSPQQACAWAATVVRRNRAELESCDVASDTSVQLRVGSRLPMSGPVAVPPVAQARSRAGPLAGGEQVSERDPHGP